MSLDYFLLKLDLTGYSSFNISLLSKTFFKPNIDLRPLGPGIKAPRLSNLRQRWKERPG
jgi:hypothetical protein